MRDPAQVSFTEAVAAGEVAAVRARLAEDPGLAAARDPSGIPALLLARYHGHGAVVDALLATGHEPDVLESAALGRAARLRDLLAADPAARDARAADGFTPLHYAAFFGGPEAVRVLLDAGAQPDADADNPMRVRPLHSAAAARDVESARLLLEAGATPDVRQQGGFTALHAAAHHDDAALAALLLRHGADPGLRTDAGADARELAGPQVSALLD
jgi:uncharacterized protein